MESSFGDASQSTRQVTAAEHRFREALLRSLETRESVGEVEAAAAQFCRMLREQGAEPQTMLVDAKRVIEKTSDGRHAAIAERAVESCIRHYYRSD